MERDYPPLTVACVKNLVDKLFEKRKLAAAEIERLTREAFAEDKRNDIVRLIGYFSQDFVMSPNPHTRKGGLLGLASVAIGLNQNACLYHGPIILPVIRMFHDNDSRVRYYACETLYNVIKLTRKETKNFLNEIFDAISRAVADPDLNVRQGALQCDRLLKEIVTEPDFPDLTGIVTLLRERIYTNNSHARQFIVSWTTALYSVPGLKVTAYLPQLLDGLFRILGDSNPDIRRQCEILLTDLLNEITTNPGEIPFDSMINNLIVHCRLSATACAMNDGTPFSSPNSRSPPNATGTVNSTAIVMDTSSQSASLTQGSTANSASLSGFISTGEQLQQRTALTWIRAFVLLDPGHLLPFASGIIGAVLPCFVMSSGAADSAKDRKAILETAVCINESLLTYVSSAQNRYVNGTSGMLDSTSRRLPLDASSNGFSRLAKQSEAPIRAIRAELSLNEPPTTKPTRDSTPLRNQIICTDAILEATCRLLNHQGLLTKLAALRWIEVLSKVRPKEVLSHVASLLPTMLTLLSDPACEVVHSTLRLVGNLCTQPNVIDLLDDNTINSLRLPVELVELVIPPSRPAARRLFGLESPRSQGPLDDATAEDQDCCHLLSVRFLFDLITLLDKQRDLLLKRGDLIITDSCYLLGSAVVYRAMSAIITFVGADLSSTFALVQALNRILLTQPALHEFRNSLRAINTEDGCHLLEQLYRAWSYNPVALLSLLLLTQNYQQCSRLIKSLYPFGELEITVDMLIEMDQLIRMIESPIFTALRMHLLDKRFSADLRETLYCLLMCLPQTGAFEMLGNRLRSIPPVDCLSDWQVLTGFPQPNLQLIRKHLQFDQLFEQFMSIQKRCAAKRLIAPKSSRGVSSTEMISSNKAERSPANLKSSVHDHASPFVVGSPTDYLTQSLSNLGINVSVNMDANPVTV
ncbi:Protein VAC14 [Fasciolopsis buskii]|uniref:Protein VAC14 homolog n=1 Tax=Fasciolopsis buskii TaxID=27845 RepID=A0A8E0RL50_9TREM|nr:Protein VAC14 [Fasciolopsis buski]